MLSHCYSRFYIFTRSELKTTVTINTEQQNICLNIFFFLFFIKTLIYEVAQSRRVTYKIYCKYVYKVPCNFWD